MNRREFLGAMAAAPVAMRGLSTHAVTRTYEITTRIELEESHDAGIAWVPLALDRASLYQVDLGHTVSGNAETRVEKLPGSDTRILVAEWSHMMPPPQVTVTMKVRTMDYAGPLMPNGSTRPPILAAYLKPTKLIPLDGIVKQTSDAITKGLPNDYRKARAIYDWIVENTVRDPEVKGCGLGDVRGMLEMKNLSGKCADLNALFVGLARAAGLPARDLYGLRVAPSTQFTSLGRAGGPSTSLRAGNVTTAQHCRAEVWADNYGWIPVDPADVRKLMLEEKKASLADPAVVKARDALFGSWEMNWIAYNDAHDVALPGSTGKPLPFLMYPQAEVGGTRLDSLDPEHFKYTITARET